MNINPFATPMGASNGVLNRPQHSGWQQQVGERAQQLAQQQAQQKQGPVAQKPQATPAQPTFAASVANVAAQPVQGPKAATGVEAATATNAITATFNRIAGAATNPFTAATKQETVPGISNTPWAKPRFLGYWNDQSLYGGAKINVMV